MCYMSCNNGCDATSAFLSTYDTILKTLLKIATDSTCTVCGNRSSPLKLFASYFPFPFPFSSTAFSSADYDAICPTSLACVCTLQLTYTTICNVEREQLPQERLLAALTRRVNDERSALRREVADGAEDLRRRRP